MARHKDSLACARVVVVDDHAPTLAYVGQLLEKDFTVAGLMPDAESLMAAWPAARPDIIVLDISLPGSSGLETVPRLRVAGCNAPVVFCSVYESPEFVRAAWAAGGLGYVAKRDLGGDLVPAIRAALRGRRFRSKRVSAAMTLTRR